jgi:hypothetical protein
MYLITSIFGYFGRRSSEMARNWRGLYLAVDCSGLMMMMMNITSIYLTSSSAPLGRVKKNKEIKNKLKEEDQLCQSLTGLVIF